VQKKELSDAKKENPKDVQAIIKGSLKGTGLYTEEELNTSQKPKREIPSIFGRYDFDLAEFPLFRLYKNELKNHDIRKPLIYTDTIKGRDGEIVPRRWEAYAGAHGFGGASTQILLYDLLQLYVEQGLEGETIRFGTIHALFQRRGNRNPSQRDYKRMIRDFDILKGYQFKTENAYWDEENKAYKTMAWGLFDNYYIFRAKHNSLQAEMPFGYVKVNDELQKIARTRGFFALGFDNRLFYALKPLEQRLAIHLAKRFRSQKMYVRYVDDLAKALPIEASRPSDIRSILSKTAKGLLEKELPILQSFKIEKAGRGREWLAYFYRKQAPKDTIAIRKNSFDPDLEFLVEELIAVSGEPGSKNWWVQCARSLGRDGIFRAIGQFKEKEGLVDLRSKGAMLTAILKDVAEQHEIKIH
jgi:hypothetical protein